MAGIEAENGDNGEKNYEDKAGLGIKAQAVPLLPKQNKTTVKPLPLSKQINTYESQKSSIEGHNESLMTPENAVLAPVLNSGSGTQKYGTLAAQRQTDTIGKEVQLQTENNEYSTIQDQ